MINEKIRQKLVLALDVETIEKAKTLVDKLSPYVGVFKVGLELFCGYGLEIINYIKEKNSDFFLDVKLHDIPNTVERASYNIIKNGATFFNVHASGGIKMMKSAREGADKASKDFNTKKPLILGVSVLTSIDEQTLKDELSNKKTLQEFVLDLAKNAKTAGLDGVVASANEIKLIKKELGDDFLVLTPGIRPAWANVDDQKRINTPSNAIKNGADFIVLGRAVTKAVNEVEAIKKIYEEIEKEVQEVI